MRWIAIILGLILIIFELTAQQIDTVYLQNPDYTRIVRLDTIDSLYYVEDFYPNGQIEMRGVYSSLNKNVKENYWCNYSTNTKEGLYLTWYNNGQPKCRYNFIHGVKNGLCEEFYSNGQLSDKGYWIQGDTKGNTRGMRHGNFKGWSMDGDLIYNFDYEYGLKINPIDANYKYLTYTPVDYSEDTTKTYPLIIYLHGGSHRGNDRNKLYGYGIPRQYKKGRNFPFIIVSPQCPTLIRWSTDNWFENFIDEVKNKYRIDTNRVYLTGVSLGGAGTWYLAIKYPDIFAAIAPMCGFTSHIAYIDHNIENLNNMPIWAFHAKSDISCPYEETERVVNMFNGNNTEIMLTSKPDKGHYLAEWVYRQQELYDWFLKYDKSNRNK